MPALGLRAKLEDDLLRPGALAERQLLFRELPSVFLEDDLDDASGQPDAFDRGSDAGEVFQQQAVGTIDADHLDVAAGEIVVQAGADADGMDGHAQPGGHVGRVPDTIVHAVGDEDDRGRLGLWRLGRPRLQRAGQRRGFSRRVDARQRLDAFKRVRLLGKLDKMQIEVALELAAPLLQLRLRLVEAGHARGVVGDAHRGRRVQEERQQRALFGVVVVAEQRPEEQEHDHGDGRPAEQQEALPLERPERPERPPVEDRRQRGRRQRDREHGRDVIAVSERDLKHEWSGLPLAVRMDEGQRTAGSLGEDNRGQIAKCKLKNAN